VREQLESWGLLQGEGLERLYKSPYSWLSKPLMATLRHHNLSRHAEAATAIAAFKRSPGPGKVGEVFHRLRDLPGAFEANVRMNRHKLFGATPTGGWGATFTEAEPALNEHLQPVIAAFMSGFFATFKDQSTLPQAR